MEKKRGIRLERKLIKVSKQWWSATVYQELEPAAGLVSKLCKWVRRGTRKLCSNKNNSGGYIQLGKEHAKLPKGHVVVYVGDGEDDTCRVVVPVIYFNHPLFGKLLRDSEEVYGFSHPGGFKIPCRISELEKVQMKIAAAGGGVRLR